MESPEAIAGADQLRIPAVQLRVVDENLGILQEFASKLELTSTADGRVCRVCFRDKKETVFEVKVDDVSCIYRAGSKLLFLRILQGSAVITMETQNATRQLLDHLYTHLSPDQKNLKKHSRFSLRTEETSAKQYFQFYGYLSQQQNMMQDYARTSTYQTAMLQNTVDFQDKVVLDVGAGTGILSFFAVQAGARKVYSIEASNMVLCCQELVKSNKLSEKIFVIAGKVEEVDVPEAVDIIISEPMGYMLFNERMLESYIHARKWLKPRGKMFPTHGILYTAPFTDDALYMEQYSKANFWTLTNFHGIDLSVLRGTALEEYFKQPILDTFDVRILMARPVGHMTDFTKADETDLHKMDIPIKFELWTSGMLHGLAFWFDVAFIGSASTVWLSTAPFQPLTHWYQIRCLLPNPVFVSAGQELTGVVHLTANERQSYTVEIDLCVTGTTIHIMSSHDLKNPNFRYMTIPPVPPGSYHSNPTEAYWESQAHQQATMPANLDQQIPTSQPLSPTTHQTINQSMMHCSHMPVMNGGILGPPATQAPHLVPTRLIMDRRYHQMQTTVHGLANAAGMINIGGNSHYHTGAMGGQSNPILLGSAQHSPSSNQFVYPSHGGHNPHAVVMQKPTHS